MKKGAEKAENDYNSFGKFLLQVKSGPKFFEFEIKTDHFIFKNDFDYNDGETKTGDGMRYLLKSLILGFEFEKEIDCLCETIDEVLDYVENELGDIYTDLLSSCQIEPILAHMLNRVCWNL